MPPITVSSEIDPPAEDMFAYATDPTRFHQWQAGVVDGRMDQPARVRTCPRLSGLHGA